MMQVGYMPVGLGVLAHPDAIVAVAQRTEELGFHSLWVGDHAFFPESFTSPYPYSSEGQFPEAVLKTDFLDPFVALGFMAAHTTRLRLGTGVCILGERNPLTTAKAAASVDRLSKGRLDFGIGIGWLREEYEALGVPWPRRAQRTEEYLELIKRLWAEEKTAFSGEFCSFPTLYSYPKPVQKPHPPIIFGGGSAAALRRAARLGDGWYGMESTVEETIAQTAELRSYAAEFGRNPDSLHVSMALRPDIRLDADTLKRLADGGVQQVILRAFAPTAREIIRTLEAMSRDIVEVSARIG
jgi:probable F420-dependent oxidoreductase